MVRVQQRSVTWDQCAYAPPPGGGGSNSPVDFDDRVAKFAEMADVLSCVPCHKKVVREVIHVVPSWCTG